MPSHASARSKWSRAAIAVASPKSQLHQRKSSRAAALIAHPGWEWLQTCTVAVSVAVHAISTVPGAMASYGYLAAIEGGSSIILAIDYLLRLLCCQHNRRYAHMRHGQAHLTWAISPSGLLALVAAYPALSDGHASARTLSPPPTFTSAEKEKRAA